MHAPTNARRSKSGSIRGRSRPRRAIAGFSRRGSSRMSGGRRQGCMQPKASDDFATWEQVAGGRKKGYIYELGAFTQASPSSHSSCSMESITSVSDVALQHKLDLLLSAFNEHRQQLEARYRAQEARSEAQKKRIAYLQAKLKEKASGSAGPTEPASEPEEEASTDSERALD